MAVIICPQCRHEYDVPLKVLQRTVKCRNCGHPFRAIARKSVDKPAAGRPQWVWPVVGVGVALVVVILLMLLAGGDDERPRDDATTADTLQPDPGDVDSGGSTTSQTSAATPSAPVRTAREVFCVDFVRALADFELDRLQDMINFSVYHNNQRQSHEPLWSDLSELDQILRKQAYLEALTNDAPGGTGFVKNAAVEATEELSSSKDRAEIRMVLRHTLNERRQERTFKLVKIGERWLLADMSAGPEYGGDLDAVAEEKPTTLDEKFERRINPEGEIALLPFLPETTEEEKAGIVELVALLIGDDRKRSHPAKERLIEIGKPAIPGLLNALVPLRWSDSDDIAKANKCVSALRSITGRHFGFAPGFQGNAARGSVEADLSHSIRRWFGWWQRYKDTWEGREDETENW